MMEVVSKQVRWHLNHNDDDDDISVLQNSCLRCSHHYRQTIVFKKGLDHLD